VSEHWNSIEMEKLIEFDKENGLGKAGKAIESETCKNLL
jgi:hypothetical protein